MQLKLAKFYQEYQVFQKMVLLNKDIIYNY